MSKLIRIWLCLLLTLGLLSCGGVNNGRLDPAPAPEQPANLRGALPGLPQTRAGAGLTETSVAGSAAYDKAASASASESRLDLAAPAGGISWGIWQLPAVDELRYLDIELSFPSPPAAESGAWLALADYQQEAWEFSGMVYASRVLELNPARHTSGGQTLFALVVVYDGASVNVNQLSLVAFHANAAPVAQLSAVPQNGVVPLTVQFSAAASSDPDADIVRYLWDFTNDGLFEAVSYTATATHVYTSPGAFEAVVAVEDSQGERDYASVAISVSPFFNLNDEPLAALAVDQDRPSVGQRVTFDASGSSDPDGSITTYEWDFDSDGAWDATGATPTAFHTYHTQSAYQARVRVTDDDGAQAIASVLLAATYAPWGCFGHDTINSGRSPYLGPQTDNVEWIADTPWSITATAAVAMDGTIYLLSAGSGFCAFDPHGAKKWSRQANYHDGSSPAIAADGTVYAAAIDGLQACDANGIGKWLYPIDNIFESSPKVGADGTVYIGNSELTFGEWDHYLRAINPDGSLKWAFLANDDVLASPAIGADGTIYFTCRGGTLYALNPDGSENWSQVNGASGTPALGADGVLYAARGGGLSAIEPDGAVTWTYVMGDTASSAPAIGADGTIYIGCRDNQLYAINPGGTLKWTYPAGDLIESTPALGADGTVYFGSWDKHVYAVKPDGSLLWSYATSNPVDAAGAIDAYGRLLIGDRSGNLYAFGPAPTNQAPVAALAVDLDRPLRGQSVTFTTAGSGDVDGDIVSCRWDFEGDGIWDAEGLSVNLPHVYSAQGSYEARLTIIDEHGYSSTATVPVVVTNTPWSCFGHDTMRSRRTANLGPATNHVKWSYPAGAAISSSPAIANSGTVYVGCDDNQLHAVHADGTPYWTYPTGGSITCSPAIGAEGVVYVGSHDHHCYAVYPGGSLKWSYATGGEVHSSPAVLADETIYFGSRDGYWYGLNAGGALKESQPSGSMIDSSVAFNQTQYNTELFICNLDGYLQIRETGGEYSWNYPTGSAITSTPAVGLDRVLCFGNTDDKLYIFYLNETSIPLTYTTGGDVTSSPAIGADGTIYVGSWDNSLYAINPDATLQWAYPTGGPVASSPAIDGNGTIYVGSSDNSVYALNPDGSLLWSYATGGAVNSSPAIGADGCVYVGSDDGNLYAFGP